MAETSPPATPEYLRWSDASITFSRADHPPKVPFPGKAALVVEAQIGGYDLARVFMDGGSGINIIYMETLKVMGVLTRKLQRSENAFHGIVPGKAVRLVGTIALDVVFGEHGHFRKEKTQLQSSRLAITVQRNFRDNRFRRIHGNPSLRVFGTQNARTKGNNHCVRELQEIG